MLHRIVNQFLCMCVFVFMPICVGIISSQVSVIIVRSCIKLWSVSNKIWKKNLWKWSSFSQLTHPAFQQHFFRIFFFFFCSFYNFNFVSKHFALASHFPNKSTKYKNKMIQMFQKLFNFKNYLLFVLVVSSVLTILELFFSLEKVFLTCLQCRSINRKPKHKK